MRWGGVAGFTFVPLEFLTRITHTWALVGLLPLAALRKPLFDVTVVPVRSAAVAMLDKEGRQDASSWRLHLR
jgi:hypothetical protein